jgi:hypothetical protein
MTTLVTPFPDVEVALMFALVPMEPTIRFVTSMPAGDLKTITARLKRISGANRDIWVDRPIVDIDVWGFSSAPMDASVAARNIQADMLSLMGKQLQTGVIQHVITSSGPRQLPEVNTDLVRYNASYEVSIHP